MKAYQDDGVWDGGERGVPGDGGEGSTRRGRRGKRGKRVRRLLDEGERGREEAFRVRNV